VAQTSTVRYEVCRYSAMMNAAAPSVGGERMSTLDSAPCRLRNAS
jgi:hypothetical protein